MTNLLEISRIDRTIDILAPVDRVWRALTDPDELSAWFRVTIEGPLEVGRSVWMTSILPEHNGLRFEVEIAELTRPSRVVWRWHPGDFDLARHSPDEPRTTVTFTLSPSASGTRLVVTETGFDLLSLERRAKAHADNSQGWDEVMVWIKTHVEAAR